MPKGGMPTRQLLPNFGRNAENKREPNESVSVAKYQVPLIVFVNVYTFGKFWGIYFVSITVLDLKPNTHRRRRRDETVLSRRVGVGGVYMNSQLAHDDCRRIRSTIWKLAKQTVPVRHRKGPPSQMPRFK